MPNNPSLPMLELVAAGLGSLVDDVVFVGGATTAFYVDDPGAPDVRATDDVDCVVGQRRRVVGGLTCQTLPHKRSGNTTRE